MSETLAKIPAYQLIGTHGPGALYEMRSQWSDRGSALHSVMIAGLDYWPDEELDELHDPVLEAILGVDKFLSPPMVAETDIKAARNSAIPAIRFPKWLVCTSCNRLGRVPYEFDDSHFHGPRCIAPKCKGRGVPVRLVVICDAVGEDGRARGHIDDFPWAWWAHGGEPCEAPFLVLTAEPGATSLRGLIVSCLNPECQEKGVRRSLGDALKPYALRGLTCRGQRPWLADQQNQCDGRLSAIFRHSSNVYLPSWTSAVSIPPFSLELYQRLEQKAQSYIRKLRRDRLNQRETDWEDIVAGIREENRWSRIYTDEQIRGALETLAFIDPLDISKHRQNERNAILHGHPDDSGRSVFVATPIPEIATSGGAMKYVQRLVRVDRLRIVQVLTGFYRGHVRGDPAPLSKQHLGWLPGMEMHGEGIFLEWRHDLLTKWASRCDVRQRAQQILGNMDADSPAQLRAHPVALLIHTLSHILIKQLALESGYGVGALRERLYVDVEGDEPMAGMLIYVASAGAGGTLGGLARQATPERLGRLLQNAVEEARWCSSDPLCIEVQAPHNGINNLAACHSCCLISETACEWGNQFLDRGLLIGVPGEPGLGLFDLLG